ncbi:MAG: hypothetical protein UT18_C0015G0001, partial [candidate division CPR2 bacterium GW2011_GWC2_39_10]
APLFNSLEIELVVLDPKHEGLPLVLSELKRFQFRVLTVSDKHIGFADWVEAAATKAGR